MPTGRGGLDSTICEVAEGQPSSSAWVHKRRGYHPLVATVAATGELVHVRLRKGAADTRAAQALRRRAGPRIRRAGAGGEADLALGLGVLVEHDHRHLERLDVGYTMGVAMVNPWSRPFPPSMRKPGGPSSTPATAGPRWPSAPTRASGSSCAGPPGRTPGRLVAREASLRLRHRPRRRRRRRRRVPPLPRHRRTRYSRPQRRGRPRARALWSFLRQRRLACLRCPGPQPHPLVRPFRRAHAGRPARRGPHVRARFGAVPGRLWSRGTPTLRGPLQWPWAHVFEHTLARLRALPPVPG